MYIMPRLRAHGNCSSVSGRQNFRLQIVQTGSGAHPASVIETEALSPELKQTGREADHFYPVAMLRMVVSRPPLPHTRYGLLLREGK
jgi:hypothetical protein